MRRVFLFSVAAVGVSIGLWRLVARGREQPGRSLDLRQALFDRLARSLITQGARARVVAGSESATWRDGLRRSPIGWLADDVTRLSDQTIEQAGRRVFPAWFRDIGLELERIHAEQPTCDWPAKLREVAERHNLNAAIVESALDFKPTRQQVFDTLVKRALAPENLGKGLQSLQHGLESVLRADPTLATAVARALSKPTGNRADQFRKLAGKFLFDTLVVSVYERALDPAISNRDTTGPKTAQRGKSKAPKKPRSSEPPNRKP